MNKNQLKRSLIGLCCLAFSSSLHAQMYDDTRMLSFETPKDLQYLKAEKSATVLSDRHFRNGKKSLEWTFKPGGKLMINKDLQFDPHIKGSRDNNI